ncbi:hypothetical protein EJV47_21950 [Hymenobacter gummosus]|uniref:Uncharacterized protein n=1 Tax=Hymenobacter gummosus TaxID=1776032 RepID=A0A3S0J786_9BACT|nr:hypothetical protein [Hymenobacter gummosus]RTQ46611.1 hypothetical protein EJV47_21950 [Hymenobacter gummosus]
MKSQLADILQLLNEALEAIGQPAIQNNPAFIQNPGFSNSEYCMAFELAGAESNSLHLAWTISSDGISFFIDRANEIPEWSYEYVIKHPTAFQQVVIALFTSWILIEHKGRRTIIRLFGEDGKQSNQFSYTQGIGLNFLQKSNYKLYQPVLFRESTKL